MKPTVSKTGQRTATRAIAAGWIPSNGLCGPGEFLRLSSPNRAAMRRRFKLGGLK